MLWYPTPAIVKGSNGAFQRGSEMTTHPNFVINSFQTPNLYVDKVMAYLTGEEYKLLSLAARRILGFQKREDHISISQFTHGVMKRDGSGSLYKGTGSCISTVKTNLASLVKFGLMVKLEKNDRKTNQGDLWTLQWEDDKINWAALEARQEQKSKTNANRITKARATRKIPQKV